MSFFDRGSNRSGNRGNKGGRGRFPNVFWQQERHKKMRFSTHFDVDYKEFNQLVRTGYLNLGGQPALAHPQAPPNPPPQSHPSIAYFPESHVHPTNGGWDNNPINPLFGISH